MIKTILKWAEQDPSKVILYDSQRTWTWQELLDRGCQYHDALQRECSLGRKPIAVPIIISRTGETIAAMLGALISGMAFAPLSAAQPIQRLQHCFSALEADFVLSAQDSSSEDISPVIKQIRTPKDAPVRLPSLSALPDVPEDQVLYVLFTSGSTGAPKGVLVTRKNLLNTIDWSREIIDWREGDVMGCATNFYFDLSMFDTFTCFLHNVPLAIYSNPSEAISVLEETNRFKVTSIFSVPVFFSQFIKFDLTKEARVASLRRIIAGGDFFSPAHMLTWYRSLPKVAIYNIWGPTETTIVNTMHRVNDSDVPRLESGTYPPVGRRHPMMPFILLDENGKLIEKPHTHGEIYMLEDCVTKGYLGDPELTQKYYGEMNGSRSFRTQDMGYIDEDGNLFILGRIGNTVKISGYRIHLGEIESAATQFPQVHLACACVMQRAEGIKELWLAVEPVDQNKEIDIFSLKQFLRKHLPMYMVPKRIVVFNPLPKNPNGKIDRRDILERMPA